MQFPFIYPHETQISDLAHLAFVRPPWRACYRVVETTCSPHPKKKELGMVVELCNAFYCNLDLPSSHVSWHLSWAFWDSEAESICTRIAGHVVLGAIPRSGCKELVHRFNSSYKTMEPAQGVGGSRKPLNKPLRNSR